MSPQPEPLPLHAVGRLPSPADNVAIAIRRLDVGTVLALDGGPRSLAHTVLEGHRFAVRPIPRGTSLLSWGLPFGTALTDIAPADYVSNQSMLDWMAVRRVEGASFPTQPNFADLANEYRLDEATYRPAPPVERVAQSRTFLGYRRPGARGVGTRNYVVVIGTTSRTASFARQLVARLQPLARVHPTLDGIVAIAHTEGGGPGEPNNTHEILRALAGFMVHANVSAVLAVDYGTEPVNNVRLQTFMRERGYALEAVPHAFLTIKTGLAAALAEGEQLVRSWLPGAAAQVRTPEPLSGLRIALQCGGSDAFSGVSGNPLAGALVHETIRHGGTGVLTEIDEAVGAENYLMQSTRDLATARTFLKRLDAFRERLRWHGVSPENNPSAGNKFRGLYNIALKSLGAVHKKDPRTPIDFVTDYAEPLTAPGFYFMNGPGNDLEGIAGQVGAGCNLFLFVTGNGSITNFPFVPTLKVTTTTRRHQLLIHEMDINAGRYLDGEPWDALVAESFEQLVATASGQRTKGEHAGHSQVSLWRNWRQTDASRVAELKARPAPSGKPLVSAQLEKADLPSYIASGTSPATERVALVLPTSLCAAQIARLAAERLNAKQLGRAQGISRFLALTHSEGCGFGGESMYHLLHRTYRGYITHANVAAALLLEHGCEKVPNDAMRRQLENANLPLDRFGWASVQLDGGIEKVIGNIERWFTEKLAAFDPTKTSDTARAALDARTLTLALQTAAPVAAPTAIALATIVTQQLQHGGSIVIPESDALLAHPDFLRLTLGSLQPHATLAYGQSFEREQAGLHIVATETDHWSENLTGLAACGAHLSLGVVSQQPQQGHPLIAALQVAEASDRGRIAGDDIDAFLIGDATADTALLRDLLAATARRTHTAAATAQGFVDFQLTRGLLGITT